MSPFLGAVDFTGLYRGLLGFIADPIDFLQLQWLAMLTCSYFFRSILFNDPGVSRMRRCIQQVTTIRF